MQSRPIFRRGLREPHPRTGAAPPAAVGAAWAYFQVQGKHIPVATTLVSTHCQTRSHLTPRCEGGREMGLLPSQECALQALVTGEGEGDGDQPAACHCLGTESPAAASLSTSVAFLLLTLKPGPALTGGRAQSYRASCWSQKDLAEERCSGHGTQEAEVAGGRTGGTRLLDQQQPHNPVASCQPHL